MDNTFIDLDILLTRIRHPKSKVYFLDAVKAYKAGALRSSLSSTWVAVVYDLIMKYRELDALGDGAAREFIRSWDTSTASGNHENYSTSRQHWSQTPRLTPNCCPTLQAHN